MGTSIATIQNMVAYSQAENATSKTEAGTASVQIANEQKADLSKKVKEQQKAIAAQQEELKKIHDRSDFESFIGSIFGSDGGAADCKAALATAGAEMKKASAEMAVKQQAIEMMLAELTAAQSELGKATSDNQKILDDQGEVLNVAMS